MFFLLFLFCVNGYGQVADSILTVKDPVGFLYEWLLEESVDSETEAPDADGQYDEAYQELIESYLFYLDNPININSDEVKHLEELGLLNAFQIEALAKYRRQFGDLMFTEELLMLDDFPKATVSVITPLIHFGKSERTKEHEKVTIGKAITKGKHQVTVNYAEKFGGTTDDNFLGSPCKLQLKYTFQYQQKLRLGIAMEKDVGEPFFFGRLDDSVRELVRTYRRPGFDFYGAHCYLTDVRLWDKGKGLVLKDLAVGDYQLTWGQGLTLWSGMSFGKGALGSSLMKRGAGVRPKASSSEGKFFRGAAATFRYGELYATGFYSIRDIEASESGYHRTLTELSKRHAYRQQVFGGHLCYAGPRLEVGYTIYHLWLNHPLELKPSKYNQYYFQSDRLTDMGLDFRWLMDKAVFYGEVARSDNGAWAGLVGTTFKPTGYINFSLLYRNYDKRYQSLFNGAFGESSRRQGEEGYYLGVQCAPASSWDLLAYCDFFRLTWLSSQVYNPSWGQEYSLKIIHQINKNSSMQLRLKSKSRMKNTSETTVFSHYPIFYAKRSVQFQISYAITDDLIFSDRASYSHYVNDDGASSQGYMICHDVAYKPSGRPYSLTFRYALFDSDDYNSRISVYENDVLGAFSIPSLSGTGQRVYLLGKIKLFDAISVYSKIGLSINSEEVKTDLKAEAIWKF